MAKRVPRSDTAQRDFQEQKNHQDFVYGTNQSLQDLANAVKSLTLTVDKLRAKSESDHKALLIEFENFKASVTLQNHKVNQHVGDIQSGLILDVHNIWKHFKTLDDQVISRFTFTTTIDDHAIRISDVKRALESHKDFCNGAMVNIRYALESKTEALRDELMTLIKKENPLEAKIEEKIRVFRQDFDSLYKETTNLKLAFGCVQKKFEHVCRFEKQQEVKK